MNLVALPAGSFVAVRALPQATVQLSALPAGAGVTVVALANDEILPSDVWVTETGQAWQDESFNFWVT